MNASTLLRELSRTVRAGIQSFRMVLPEIDPVARIVVQFRDAGAVSPPTAQRFHPATPVDEQAFERMLRCGVIRQTRPGRYYLHEATLAETGFPWWSGVLD